MARLKPLAAGKAPAWLPLPRRCTADAQPRAGPAHLGPEPNARPGAGRLQGCKAHHQPGVQVATIETGGRRPDAATIGTRLA
jgi:hypothetical protein